MMFVEHINEIPIMLWKEKFERLFNIAFGLYQIHREDLIHRDFHLGNILFSKENNETYITDLGLCKPANTDAEDEKVYGVLPYVAPEVLHKKIYEKASDIYSFGIIMCQVLSGVSPFGDVEYDDVLAIKICDGERPGTQNIPPLIIELIKKCWDADPSNRPLAEDLCKILYAWKDFKEKSELASQIQESEMNKTRSSTSHTNQTKITTSTSISKLLRLSKLLDFEEESEENQTSSSRVHTVQPTSGSKLLDFKNLPQPKN
jgi:serine/threonine protein kinase